LRSPPPKCPSVFPLLAHAFAQFPSTASAAPFFWLIFELDIADESLISFPCAFPSPFLPPFPPQQEPPKSRPWFCGNFPIPLFLFACSYFYCAHVFRNILPPNDPHVGMSEPLVNFFLAFSWMGPFFRTLIFFFFFVFHGFACVVGRSEVGVSPNSCFFLIRFVGPLNGPTMKNFDLLLFLNFFNFPDFDLGPPDQCWASCPKSSTSLRGMITFPPPCFRLSPRTPDPMLGDMGLVCTPRQPTASPAPTPLLRSIWRGKSRQFGPEQFHPLAP